MAGPTPSVDLFPLSPGCTWTYRYGALTFTSNARGRAYVDGGVYQSVESSGPDGVLLYQVRGEEIVYCPLTRVMGRDPGGRIAVLRLDARPGLSWPTEDGQRIVKVAAWEEVTAPVGTLRCLRVESSSAEHEALETSWYAPGVGLVRKRTAREGADLELVGFTVPEGPQAAALQVESEPAGGEVVLGVFPTGQKTPASFPGLAAGRHQIALLAGNGLSWQRTVFLSPSASETVRFSPGRFGEPTTFSASYGLRSGQINALLAAGDGSLWCGTHGGGASRYRQGIWGHFDQHNSGADDYVTAFAETADGAIWLATHGRGLARFHASRDEFSWRGYRRETSDLGDDFLSCLTVDGEGALWIGTESAGLARLQEGAFARFDPGNSPLPSAWIRDLACAPDGTLWVATDEGLVRSDGGEWRATAAPPHPRRLSVTREGDLWCGTFGGGVHRLRGEGWEAHSVANGDLLHDQVWALAQDEAGSVWVGTGRGATCFDGEQWMTVGSEVVGAIAFTPRAVWLGTTAGLTRLPRAG